MKLRSLLSTLAIGTAIAIGAPAHAQGSDPCSVYTCMVGYSSGAGGPGCTAAYFTFFSMQIWDPDFDPGATATERQQFLLTCPGATYGTNEGLLEGVISSWGGVP
jgi:hypothetical protein